VNLADAGSLESFPADAWPWRDSLIVVFQLSVTPQESVPASSGVRRWPMRAHLTLRDATGPDQHVVADVQRDVADPCERWDGIVRNRQAGMR
jgi:hypothetical protein